MNNATKHDPLPPLVADLLCDPVTYIDNVFADGWKRLSVNTLITKAGLANEQGLSSELAIDQLRSQIQDQFDSLNYAARLWSVFRSLVTDTLNTMRQRLNCTLNDIMEKLDERVSGFLVQALQLDAFTMQLEHKRSA